MSKTVSYAQWSLEPYCIGMKLRTLRTQKGLTLSRLAAETGLSTALLSKLETDRMIPTLPTLATISRVYGVGMSYFFSEPARHTLSITRKAHLQGNGRGVEVVKSIPLNALSEGPRLEARMIEFPPSGVCSTTEQARPMGWSTCWKGGSSWTPVGCTNYWKPAIAPTWRARWQLPGARPASTAAGSLRWRRQSPGRRTEQPSARSCRCDSLVQTAARSYLRQSRGFPLLHV